MAANEQDDAGVDGEWTLMTLDEFMVGERERLAAFEKMWRSGMKSNPEQFPAQLWSGDWDEQFIAFHTVAE